MRQGAIYAQSILGANFVFDLMAAIRDFVGGHSRSYERLLAKADVFIQNFRPGVAQKLGLSYEELSAQQPRLKWRVNRQ